MPNPPAAGRAAYQKLLTDIRGEIESARRAVEQRLVRTYWAVGRVIEKHLARHGGRSPYGKNIFLQLADDLGMNDRVLYSYARFYRVYPDARALRPIKWSHYRYLSMIDSPSKREAWEKRIVKEDLTLNEFLFQLKEEREDARARKGSSVKLSVTRGFLYHYRLIKVADFLERKSRIMVDCGFENRIDLPPGSGELTNKRIVKSEWTGSAYRLKFTNATAARIYTYRAVIERVIDADTLLANVDCGFGIMRRERLRLEGINAPEISTTAGRKAARWVEGALAECPFVVIRSSKSGKYGRYLADVFYLPKEDNPHTVAAEGRHLNQDLLDHSLAELYSGTHTVT